jgi:chromosome segregation ATPase
MNGIRLKKTGIVSQLSEIQTVNNSDVHLSALEDELRELKEVNETADEQLGDLVGLLRNANEEVKGVQAEKKEIDARKREISARESEYETLMENFINSSRNASREIEKATDKVERIRLTIVESEAVIVRQQDEVAQKYKIAVEETPNHIADWDREPIPILASESRSSLTKKIAKLRAMVRSTSSTMN